MLWPTIINPIFIDVIIIIIISSSSISSLFLLLPCPPRFKEREALMPRPVFVD